jgi:hypothetical protein
MTSEGKTIFKSQTPLRLSLIMKFTMSKGVVNNCQLHWFCCNENWRVRPFLLSMFEKLLKM